MKRFILAPLAVLFLCLCGSTYAANTNSLRRMVMDITTPSNIDGINALHDATASLIEDDNDSTYVYYNDSVTPPDTGGGRYALDNADAADQIGHIQDVSVPYEGCNLKE